METVVKTEAKAVGDFLRGLSGRVHVTFEEGTHAAWLYEVIRPLVAEVIVCDPRRNKLVEDGNKSDKIDANKLAELLRGGHVKAVYHGSPGMRTLKELTHSYDALVDDTTRVMNRIKAVYRGQGIPSSGRDVYRKLNRDSWLTKLPEGGLQLRTEFLYQELDALQQLRQAAKRMMLAEARRHSAYRVLKTIPGLGPIRVAQIMATVVQPERFRTKRQLWTYCGLAVVTRSSADYEWVGGKVQRRKTRTVTRGLNWNFNRRMKQVFKAAAVSGMQREPFQTFYAGLIAKGMREELARVTLARKIAAITLKLWKKGEVFDGSKLKPATT
jgi:transposase